jgi:hypothetical protein
MTKFLSEALQAREPYFRHGLRRLERANGDPSTDIRLTGEVIGHTKAKLKQLSLDPHDTTDKELYQALLSKLHADDKTLVKSLRTIAALKVNAEGQITDGIVAAINELPESKRCYGIKSSKMKAMFRKNPPKKALKSLGYRSLESALKHEPVHLILTAAWLSESMSWRKHLQDQYKKLSPLDFEDRQISVSTPKGKKWLKLSDQVVSDAKHNVISFKELGAVVVLNLPNNVPAGVTTASLALSLSEINDIRAYSTFLKLNQVRPDFGDIVVKLINAEPELDSKLFDQPVPWNLIQRYYAKLDKTSSESIFEPYLRLDDMVWQPIEEGINSIESKLSFWRDSAHLAVIAGHKPVSFNIIDTALNLCNAKSFEDRVNHYLKRSLWHELLLRYLNHEPVEQTVLSQLQPEFATEAAGII